MIIMSNNQWKCDINHSAWAKIGMDCSAQGRAPGLLRAYKTIQPDVLCVQESSQQMEKILLDALFFYTAENGEQVAYRLITGGDTPIFYRGDKYAAIETGYCQHPEELPGHEGKFNNGRSKSYTWAVLEEKESGKRLIAVSTHLWWKSSNPEKKNYQPYSDEARAYQIGLVLDKAEELMNRYRCPAFVMGDFNAALGSLCMNKVYDMGWVEARDLSTGDKDATKGHHCCFADGFRRDPLGRYEDAIDHIIVPGNTQTKILHYKRLNDNWFDCISDHYPLYIETEL